MKTLPTRKKTIMVVLALAAGISLAITCYSLFLQRFGGSLLRVMVVLIPLAGLFSWVSYRVLDRHLTSEWLALPLRVILGWVFTCLLAAGLLIASLDRLMLPDTIHFFFPRHTLEIGLAEGETIEPGQPPVKIRSWSDGDDFAFDMWEFQFNQDWLLDLGELQSRSPNPSPVRWTGSLLNRGQLAFWSEPGGPKVQVTWDGESQIVDLNADGVYQVIVKLPVDLGFPTRYLKLFSLACYWLGMFCFFLFTTVYCYCRPIREPSPGGRRAPFWLYALPMIAVWGLFLLVFYPGILSPDSLHQWRMASGMEPVSDWHPAIHTLLWWLVKQVWNSPVPMAILQILALSLTAAWGIDGLREMSLPRWGAWLMSGLFALSPANSTMAITMWKDVFYGISLFGLFLIGLKMTASRGEWITKRGAWVGLGLVAAAASLFRHNGLMVVVVVLALLWLVYGAFRKRILISAALALGVWFLVSYPLYNLAGVQRVSGILRDTIFLHHIGAHVSAGTSLTDEERDYFNALQPMDQWRYNCCNVSPLYFDPNFNSELFNQNQGKHLRMALDLFLRDPLVDIRHTVCSSSLVWRICNDRCGYVGHFIVDKGDDYQWVEPNDYGIHEQSLLPGLVNPLAKWIVGSNSGSTGYWLWTPAFYLYLGLLAVTCLALRRRSWAVLMIAAPLAVQSAVMIVATLSTDFRYQYGVYLMGLFSVGLLLLVMKRSSHQP